MNRLIDYMISNNLIPAEDRELYAYGLKQGAIMLLNIVTTLLIGVVTGMIWQSVLFICAYIPLRSFAGGYHARTQMGCYFVSTILVFFCVLLIQMLQEFALFSFVLTTLAGIMIFLIAPLADDNKPLEPTEFQAYRIKSRKILGLELVTFLILLLLGWQSVAACIAVSLVLQCFMLLLHKLLHMKIV